MVYTKLSQHYKSAVEAIGDSCRVLGVCLYGSQNYGLDTPASDVDTKAFIMPSLSDLIKYRKVSRQIVGDDEGGLCDLKHLELMCQNFVKQNINFLELLYTDYFICRQDFAEAYALLRTNRDFITSAYPRRMLHASAGMASQKFHALRHPYESKQEILAKYGYDPKQLASMLRLQYFIDSYIATGNFEASITPVGSEKELILNVKAGSLSEQQAVDMARECMYHIDTTIETEVNQLFPENTDQIQEVQKFLDDWVEKTIVNYLKGSFR